MDMHAPKFERNTVTGMWRGWCLCGWSKYGTKDEVLAESATHDLIWVAVDVTKEPADAV